VHVVQEAMREADERIPFEAITIGIGGEKLS